MKGERLHGWVNDWVSEQVNGWAKVSRSTRNIHTLSCRGQHSKHASPKIRSSRPFPRPPTNLAHAPNKLVTPNLSQQFECHLQPSAPNPWKENNTRQPYAQLPRHPTNATYNPASQNAMLRRHNASLANQPHNWNAGFLDSALATFARQPNNLHRPGTPTKDWKYKVWLHTFSLLQTRLGNLAAAPPSHAQTP